MSAALRKGIRNALKIFSFFNPSSPWERQSPIQKTTIETKRTKTDTSTEEKNNDDPSRFCCYICNKPCNSKDKLTLHTLEHNTKLSAEIKDLEGKEKETQNLTLRDDARYYWFNSYSPELFFKVFEKEINEALVKERHWNEPVLKAIRSFLNIEDTIFNTVRQSLIRNSKLYYPKLR